MMATHCPQARKTLNLLLVSTILTLALLIPFLELYLKALTRCYRDFRGRGEESEKMLAALQI
jgi:hypothetical protein